MEGDVMAPPHWPSPHPIWFLSRGVPITRPNVTRCFWHIYNKAVQLTHWNTVKVTEHNSIKHDNEISAPWYIGSTGIILGSGPANGGRRNGAPHWPSPHPIWSLSRGVPIPRPKVTRCFFWQIYKKAVQLVNWNTVKVIENNHSSMQHINEVFAQW